MLDKDCNPHNGKGERNIHCHEYERCLDYVVSEGWEFWSCLICDYRNIKSKGILKSPQTNRNYRHSPVYYLPIK